jgi:catechol 2,3-dioxygenase-like lactoylglutathione lyase family enzyme
MEKIIVMPGPLLEDVAPHHFCISVGDREAAIAWWSAMFGFTAESRFEIPHIGAKGAFVRNGAMRIEIFEIAGSAATPLERQKPNTDLQTQGVKHFCFSVDNVQAAVETLKAAGVEIVGVARGVGQPMRAEDDVTIGNGKPAATAFFFNDPWGSLIEILSRHDFPV